MVNVLHIDHILPAHIEIDIYEIKGWGIKTTKPIKSGEIIYEFPICKLPEHSVRVMSVFGERIIDPDIHLSKFARKYGIFAYWDCFLNHSYEPNAIHDFKFKIKNGRMHSTLIALKDIESGSEILIDYDFIADPDRVLLEDETGTFKPCSSLEIPKFLTEM
jgi:SET domain-containing protein